MPDTAVTRILARLQEGESASSEELLPLVYQELRRLAAARLAQEAAGQTLQPTALVHEAYLRLIGNDRGDVRWDHRGHFFAAAAEAMRRILVESARRKGRLKHGGGRQRVLEADVAARIPEGPEDLLSLDEALTAFAEESPDKAELVKLRYFAGLSEAEAAQALGISRATASRWWTYAKAWMYDRLQNADGE